MLMKTKFGQLLTCTACMLTSAVPTLAQPLLVDASKTQLRGLASISLKDLYPTFQIEVHTGSGEPHRAMLQYTGKQEFDVNCDQVVRISYNDLQKRDKFVLWPVDEERTPQCPITTPFTKFELVTFEQIKEQLKPRVRREVLRGDFDAANRLLNRVHSLYEDNDTDSSLRPDLRAWFQQIYETLADAAAAFREQPAFRAASNQAQLIELERGWHSWMVRFNNRIAEEGTDDRANIRLAYALRQWANFAKVVYTNEGTWPSESMADSVAKSRINSDYKDELSHDLLLVSNTLTSPAVESVLSPKIINNLSPTLTKLPSKAEVDHLSSYQQLMAASKEENFSIANFSLAKLDKAISGFNYFYHREK